MAKATSTVRMTTRSYLGGRDTLVRVRNRIVPRVFELELNHDAGRPDLVLRFEVREGVPQCRSAELHSTGDGREVLASDLRGVRLEDLLEFALVQVAQTFETTGEGDTAVTVTQPAATEDERRRTLSEMRGVRREARRKVTDSLLRDVARIYRENVRSNPTAAVEVWSGRSHRTAALYVQLARERVDPQTGQPFLGASIQGRAGEQS